MLELSKSVAVSIVAILMMGGAWAATPDEDEDVESALILSAIPVSELPDLDGDYDDEEWRDAPVLQVGAMRFRAVYTDEHLALLMKWIDRDLKMSSTGVWTYDPEARFWTQLGTGRQEWLNIAWNISGSLPQDGCDSFCHEDPIGSGEFHHQTVKVGDYVNSWMIFGKHGFSAPKTDLGWFLGESGYILDEELIFETTNDVDPRLVLAGDVTFFGYAEDVVIAAPEIRGLLKETASVTTTAAIVTQSYSSRTSPWISISPIPTKARSNTHATGTSHTQHPFIWRPRRETLSIV